MTDAHHTFLSYYLRFWDARKAASASGYDPNYGKTLVQQLEPIIRSRMGEDYMTDEELEKRLVDIARGIPPDYIDNFGFVDFERLKADNKTHLIKSIKRNKQGVEVTMYDSQRALELIGKSRGVVLGELKRNLHLHKNQAGKTRVDQLVDRIYGARDNDDSSEEEVVDAEFKDME